MSNNPTKRLQTTHFDFDFLFVYCITFIDSSGESGRNEGKKNKIP